MDVFYLPYLINMILQEILKGYKQGNGIVCSHCDTEVTLFMLVSFTLFHVAFVVRISLMHLSPFFWTD